VGNHITMADLHVFVGLHKRVTQLSDEEKYSYSNIFRWFKHIQSLDGIRHFLQRTGRLLVKDPKANFQLLSKKKK
jgi:hypothetical protein